MTAEAPSTDAVLGTVVEMITQVVGDDFLVDLDVGMATSFSEDLELESIEFIALAERLESRYAGRVDFASWVADMELEQIMGLTVGDVVEFLVACLS